MQTKPYVLVTGGAGYVGSHFCKLARAHGLLPIVYDDLSTGHERFVFGPLVTGDIRDHDKLKFVLKKFAIKTVFHFAGKALVAESVKLPEVYHETNVNGMAALLKALQQSAVKNLIFSSSCTVYGLSQAQMLAEDHPLNPIHPYGQSKRLAEQLALELQKQQPLNLGILRYFNVIGQDPEGELWEDHSPETHIVPNILQALVTGRSFSLHGIDFPTSDGTAVRDYINVNDLVAAHLKAFDLLQEQPLLISNVGSGCGISNLQLVRRIERFWGKQLDIRWTPRREGDAPALVADPGYFKTWYPQPLKTLEESLFEMAPHFLCEDQEPFIGPHAQSVLN